MEAHMRTSLERLEEIRNMAFCGPEVRIIVDLLREIDALTQERDELRETLIDHDEAEHYALGCSPVWTYKQQRDHWKSMHARLREALEKIMKHGVTDHGNTEECNIAYKALAEDERAQKGDEK